MALNCNVLSEARAIRMVGSRAERGAYLGPEGHGGIGPQLAYDIPDVAMV